MSGSDRPIPTSAQAWSDELARIIWRQDIAPRLIALARWLGYRDGVLPPPKPSEFADFANAERGLKIQLHYPFWDRVKDCDPAQWAISGVTFDAARAPLPFGLDALQETPETARTKLSDDVQVFAERRSVSYFLDDDRVVTIKFKEAFQGIEEIALTRIGGIYADPL